MQPHQDLKPEVPQAPDSVTSVSDLPDPSVANPIPSEVRGLPSLQSPNPVISNELNLSDGEGVYCQISRHPIGLAQFYASTALGISMLLAMLFFFIAYHNTSPLSVIPIYVGVLLVVILSAVIGAINYIAVNLYNSNRMFLTNESLIIQEQKGLFNKNSKTLGLESVEDISYTKEGIMQDMFDYGTIKVSTVGSREGIDFLFAKNPKQYTDYIINARERHIRGGVHL